ncbi:MAG: helix-turn-helix domain-containing protein [Pseudomonadales bacterium]|nr:helix-turn-helix domain-containing protein [Pseudomonadales bacterium]
MIAFYLFGVFALVGVILKTLILAQVSTRTRITFAFVVLTLLFIAQNAFEFLGFWTFESNAELAFRFIDGLMVTLFFISPAAVHFIGRTIGNRMVLFTVPIFIAFATYLTYLLFSRQLVLTYEHIGYTIVSVPGPSYSLLQYYALSALVVAVVCLLIGLANKDSEIRTRSRILLIAFAPIFLVSFGVNLLKLQGFNSSTAILMPLASTFFIWVLMYLARDEVVTFRLKWRQAWFLVGQLKRIVFSNYSFANQDYLEFIEREQLKTLLEVSDGKQSEVAKILGTSPATICRKVAKYGLLEDDLLPSEPYEAMSKSPQ